jgi:hypothetical protein
MNPTTLVLNGTEVYLNMNCMNSDMRLRAIADNLNNILTVISGHAALMRARLDADDPIAENVEGITDAVHSAAALARRLVLLSGETEILPR